MEEAVNLNTVIDQVCREKNISRQILTETVEQAVLAAAKKVFEDRDIEATFDPETGHVNLFQVLYVVDEIDLAAREITLEQAQRAGLEAEVGDELLFQIFYLDGDRKRAEQQAKDYPEIEALQFNGSGFGRIAAQTAKQVIIQRVREAERDAVFEEYAGKEGEILVGTVQRVEPRQTIIELGKGTEAILPFSEQVRNEHLRSGQRVKVMVLEVLKAAKGPQVVVSRSHRSLLRRLFEMEVPEIAAGTVEIKSIAREGGHRSKVAVHSRMPSIDAIGACVGMRGARIQNIVNELSGERIDVIKWDPNPAAFVSNALSPAEVVDVSVDADDRKATVVVPDRMLSLAIGKEGQNARLAAKLTGWRIDILSESAAARAKEGEVEEASTFVPFAPGETPDIDIIEEAEEVAAAAIGVPIEEEGAEPSAVPSEPQEQPVAVEEDVTFAAALAQMPIPDREERESEDYGEEHEDEDEEYEVPTMVVPEARPTAIRFAEDVLPSRPEAEEEPAKKGAAKKARRAPRFAEEGEDEMEDIDYSGRIH